ncbi:Sugar lactone lactonase YvrE [Bryocella elongata]|uniref:Sugar lactone lactonase YvrE n=1 Tax=Bryocella elongata TaxID=863522 RepID=A0A1H6AEU8_9BACT|nr:Ig-like domain repeat protein [Bryocella elongata]SEG46545.1 Sugar lactone lactonase YvrE [Bryocella elongata]
MNLRPWFRVCGSVASAILSVVVSGLVMGTGVSVQAQSLAMAPTTALGATSATQTATVTITTAGTLANINVLTQGAAGLDYAFVAGGTCATTTMYTVGQTCTVSFTFAPSKPWTRYGAISLSDSSGILLGNIYLVGTGTGPQVSYPLGASSVPTILANAFLHPKGIAVDGSGNVYVADTGNSTITELVAVGGVIPANPSPLTLGTGFSGPTSVAVDGAGNVFVADTGNNMVKELVAVNGVVSTTPVIVSIGSGYSSPSGVAVDASGNVYVADTANNAVEEIQSVNGVIPAAATPVTLSSAFSMPTGIAVDPSGNVYVADTNNSAVKEIVAVGGAIPATPTITPLGTGFQLPTGVAVDGNGNVYVGDSGNNAVKEILAVSGAIPASPTIVTLSSGFTSPSGLAVDGSFDLYVTNTGGNAAAELNAQTAPTVNFASTAVGQTSTDSPVTVPIANTGTDPLIFAIPGAGSNPAISTNFTIGAASTCPQTNSTATTPAQLAPGASCTNIVSFSPLMAGTISGALAITDNNLNLTTSTQSITLAGQATPGTVTLAMSTQSVPVNTASVTLSTSLTYGSGPAPTGAVTFSVNSGAAIPATCTGSSSPLQCTATYNTASLTANTYAVTANSAADSNYNSATTGTTLTITQATPTIALGTSGASSTVNGSVTLTATVTPTSGITPSGKVAFSTTVGSATSTISGCGSVALVASAGPTLTATCTTTSLVAGSNSVNATLQADTNFVSVTSSSITQAVAQGTPAITLGTSGANTTVNMPVTLTATVTPNSGITPSGTVAFNTVLGGVTSTIANCGTVALVSAAGPTLTATCQTSTLGLGSNSVTATIAADSNFFTATSGSVVQTVAVAPTTLVLSPTTASTVDSAITFTATLSSTSGFSPLTAGGTVGFTAGGVTIPGCAAVSVSGTSHTATCTTSSLVAPADQIGASYTPDTNFAASTAAPVTQTMAKNTPVISVSSTLPTTAVVNQTVTFTATVTPNGASGAGVVPTGSIIFSKGGTQLCGAVVVAGNSATGTGTASCAPNFTTSFSSTNIVATYSSDANFFAGTPGTVAQTVLAAPTATAVTSNPTSVGVNQNVTLTATVTAANSGAGYPGTQTPQSGTVNFYDSVNPTTSICSSPVSGGVVQSTCSYAPASLGTHVITASFTSTDNNFASTLASAMTGATITVGTSSVGLALTASGISGITVNQSGSFMASFNTFPTGLTSSPGTITYFDGSTAISGATCSNVPVSTTGTLPGACSYAFATAGQHPISAIFTPGPGGASFSTLTSNVVTVTPAKTATTLSITSPTAGATATTDQVLAFSATVAPVTSGATTPSGSVVFAYSLGGGAATTICTASVTTAASTSSAACSGPLPATGTYTITATYSSDSNFSAPASPTAVSQTVTKTATTLALVTPTSAAINTAGTYTATVSLPGSITDSASGLAMPTGTVTITDLNNPTVTCTANVVAATGVASCSLTPISSGSHSISASYSGDGNFSSSAVPTPQTVSVALETPTLTLTPSATSIVATQSVTFTAVLSFPSAQTADTPTNLPTGISISPAGYSCSNPTQTGSVTSYTYTCVVPTAATSSSTIQAAITYGGDGNYNAVTATPVTVAVQTFTPTVVVSSKSSTISFAQGYTSASDPFNPAVIKVTAATTSGFVDPLAITACSVTSGGTLVSTLTCAPTPASGTISGQTVVVSPTSQSTVTPIGTSYILNVTVTDTANSNLKMTATQPLTIVNFPASVNVLSVGTVTAQFTATAGQTGLQCGTEVYSLVSGTYVDDGLLSNINVSCSNFAENPAGTYTFTLTAGTKLSLLEKGGGKIEWAYMAAPFLLLLGLLPRMRRSRKALLQGALIFIVGLILSQATGCSSGGFVRSNGAGALDGSYLINIKSTSGATVAEVPFVVQD